MNTGVPDSAILACARMNEHARDFNCALCGGRADKVIIFEFGIRAGLKCGVPPGKRGGAFISLCHACESEPGFQDRLVECAMELLTDQLHESPSAALGASAN